MERKQLNTPVNGQILDNFRNACNSYNLKMNVVIESFMKDFSEGDYDILLSRDSGIKLIKKVEK